jgi:hypothetical protein
VNEVPAEEDAAQLQKRFVDVGAAFVADSKAAEVVHPGQGAFHHPPVPAQTLAGFKPPTAMRCFMPRFRGKRGINSEEKRTCPSFVPVPTRLAEHTNPQLGTPARLAAGANLPQFTVDIMEIDRRLKRFRSNGYVIYGVYASHPKRGNGAKAARESPP